MNHPLDALFDQFLKERRYLKNVTEATLVWYRVAFSNYTSFVADDHASLPTKASLQGFVMSLRDRGIKPGHLQHLHQRDECLLRVASCGGLREGSCEAAEAARRDGGSSATSS